MQTSSIICLMGPTAVGKSQCVLELIEKLPCEIISVDSAMVYCGMDIGTAKPTPKELKKAPHRLIDICDPSESYSAGQFRQDALSEIETILAHQKIPLLVGGTMLYFRALQQGLAKLPTADSHVRARIESEASELGWPALHQELRQIDPKAAQRIHPNDAQRIQRALEVFEVTGKTLTEWIGTQKIPLPYSFINIGLFPEDRGALRKRIAERFHNMLRQGFVTEVERLYHRGDLHAELPSMRAVGYRQIWDYLAGRYDYDAMCERAINATCQLAKRQLTWLKTWPNLHSLFNADEKLLTKLLALSQP